jgi:hypothetical protein
VRMEPAMSFALDAGSPHSYFVMVNVRF